VLAHTRVRGCSCSCAGVYQTDACPPNDICHFGSHATNCVILQVQSQTTRVFEMVKVLVVGYGVIGQRLADGVALQKDMELVGVVDAAPTLSIRALRDRGMPYRLFAAFDQAKSDMEAAGIPVSGTMQDVLPSVDIVLDATSAGIGAKNKKLYQEHGKKA